MHVQTKQLKDFIIDSGLISLADFEKVEKEFSKNDGDKKGESLEKMLVSRGLITEDDLRRIQAYVLGIPFGNGVRYLL